MNMRINILINRSVAIIVTMLLCSTFASAHKVIQTSDKLRPHWLEHETGRYRHPQTGEYTYEYKCISSSGMDITSLQNNCVLRLKDYLQAEYEIVGDANTEYSHENNMGNIYDTDSYSITFHTKTTVEKFTCQLIDNYWEKYDDGEYCLYTLFAVSIPNVMPHFDDYQKAYDYNLTDGVTRSLIPGWGQIYKGSKVKGGLIIAGEALGVGGIVASFSMKASYEKLMQEDPKHKKDYSISADMWQNIGYGCIAFTAAIYIYNLIDAAVAPGARRIKVYPRNNSVAIAPAVTYDGSVGIAMKYNF